MKKYAVPILFVVTILGLVTYLIYHFRYGSLTPYTPDPKTPTPEEIKTQITSKEVKKHNKKNDCWVLIDNSVYDMTNFVSLHPGGDAILKGCGIDATSLFNSVTSHTDVVQEFIKKFKIGILVDN